MRMIILIQFLYLNIHCLMVSYKKQTKFINEVDQSRGGSRASEKGVLKNEHAVRKFLPHYLRGVTNYYEFIHELLLCIYLDLSIRKTMRFMVFKAYLSIICY